MPPRLVVAIVHGYMSHDDEDAAGGPDELDIGDVVQLREPHNLVEAGTRGRVIGFYAKERPEALLALDDGRHVSVPSAKLEQVS